jgi:hypothetical protein
VNAKQRRKREKRRRHVRGGGSARRRIVAGAGLGITAALGAGGTAHAADFLVNQGGDAGDLTCDGTCTLRDALDDAAANNNPATVDQVLFAANVTGTITLSGTELPTIDEPLYIDGPGAGALTVSGNNASRILQVDLPDAEEGGDVTVSGLTLSGGRVTGGGTTHGGGIANYDAELTILDSTISGNAAVGGISAGGGVSSKYSTTIRDSTIANNVASSQKYGGNPFTLGGGLATAGNLSIVGSTISGNDVTANAVLDMNPMTDHDATAFGGGLVSFAQETTPATLERSTISGNDASAAAPPGFDASAGGGGLAVLGPMRIDSATVAGNSAGYAAGVYANDPALTVLANTIVADNSAATSPDLGTGSSSNAFPAAFSLIEDPAGASLNETGPNVTGVDPQLGPLADNRAGQTLKPAPTSPAIDQGLAGTATTDQRGQPRPFDAPGVANASGGDGADIGAIELQDADLAPDTAITKAPKNKVKLKRGKKKKKVTFEFTSSDPGSTFQCSLDDRPFEPCAPPDKLKVKKGKHEFEVRAVDAAGNVDPTPAGDDWKVKKRKKKK